MKKQVLSNKAICFPAEKEKLLSHRGKWYKSLDPVEKKSFCPNQQIGVNHLVMQKKQNLLSSRAIWYKSLDTAQK